MVCLFCAVVWSPPSPTTCPPNRTPTPATTMAKLSLFRTMKQPTLRLHLLLWHYPLVPAQFHSLLMAPPLRAPRVDLPAPVLAQAPTSPTAPPPPSRHPGAGSLTPVPHWPLGPVQAISSLFLCPLYTAALAVTTAQAARRPYICFGRSGLKVFVWCPEHSSGSQSLWIRGWLEGGSGGNIRPVNTTVLWIIAMHPPPRLHHSPNQLRAATLWAPVVGGHGQACCLPRWVTR